MQKGNRTELAFKPMISLQCTSFPDFHLNPGFRTPPQVLPPWNGGKTCKNLTKFFLRLRDICKKYILQKNWSKTTSPGLSSDQHNLQAAIWGRHHQLDDHHRNPNINTEIIEWATNYGAPEESWS